MKKIRQAFKFVVAWFCHQYRMVKFNHPLKANMKQWTKRVAICTRGCEFIKGNECSICECRVNLKAEWLDQDCPKDKWNKSDIPEFLRKYKT